MMYRLLLFTNTVHQLFAATAPTTGAVSNCPDVVPSDAAQACNTGLPKVTADNGALQTALQILFGALAAVAVLMIVITALRMVINAGEPENVKRLRRTLVYSAVGLMIALTADALVGFVLSRFTG